MVYGGRTMTTYHFKAQALTPIHVGSGMEIDPLQFALDQENLLWFHPTQVMSALPEDERQRLTALIDQGNLKGIQLFLRTHLQPQHGVLKVGVSKRFHKEFSEKSGSPDRNFRVDMMPRNPVSGRALLPGSSIKGAIRTAVVNYFANVVPHTKPQVHARVAQATRNKAQVLEEAALNRKFSQTERDFFRLISVRDVELPSNATRIDRAVNWNPRKSGSEKMQIWVERVVSLADTWKPPTFQVTIHLDEQKMNFPQVERLMGRKLPMKTLLDACNHFYWRRMLAEADKFYDRKNMGQRWKAIYERFPRAQTPDGQLLILDPDSPYWFSNRHAKKRVLLRIGRFSHFESLSVDELRQGDNIQARQPIKDMGSTRTLCAMENNMPEMPFGWLVLTTEENL